MSDWHFSRGSVIRCHGLQRCVVWKPFRALLNKVYQKRRKNNASRKPYDVVLMFKVLVLQHQYNRSDEQTEFQIRGRYSFCRFLSLNPKGQVPDALTVWLFRERPKEHDPVEVLFDRLMEQIDNAGFIARPARAKSSILVLWRHRTSEIAAMRTRRSRIANRPRSGKTSQMRCSGKRMWMRAGRGNVVSDCGSEKP